MKSIVTASTCLLALLAGCALAEPPVPGGWDTYTDMNTWYRRHAWEWDGRCRMPYLDGVLEAQTVEETDEELTLRATYYWRDRVGDDTGSDVFPFGSDRCKGIEERTFVLAKQDDGSLETIGMDGLQRGGKVPSMF